MAEFKISRLRFTWKGIWDTGVIYKRDAVVSYNGKTYVCLYPHTAALDFYSDLSFVTGDGEPQPRWELMVDGNTWIGDWTPSTTYSEGNIVRYGGTIYQCTIPHTSGVSNIDLANWGVYVLVGSEWLGSWTPATSYIVGDIVKYGGVVYRCVVGHVAATLSLGLEQNISSWEIIDAGVEYKGIWTATTRYKLNDLVKESSNIWICIVGHTSSTDFSVGTTWQLWLEGVEFQGSWSSSTIYQLGDVVVYGGYSYFSVVSSNLNNVPSTETDEWELLTTGYELKAEWSASAPYKIGDVVRAGGNLFVAKQDNVAANPTIVTDGVVPGGQERRRTCTSSTDRTLIIDDTDGISVGMYVSSVPGTTQYFKNGQTVTEVIDSTTLIISQPADESPNGQEIDFFGVNDNWEIIAQQVRWTNRWALNTQYIAGDIAVWVNVTYRCVKTHQANQNPLDGINDNTHYWVIYLQHDRFNVLNLPGDIVVNSEGDNQSLSIGPEGFLLKSVNGVPTWQNVFQTTNVFYVTPLGTDLEGSGTTWDNPYGSIKYACDQVAKGVFNPTTRSLLTNNKEFIVAEAYGYQVDQVDPFLDEEKTKRDARLIVDGIIYDISRGGNSQTVANTLAFFDLQQKNKFINLEVETSISSFVQTIERLFDLTVSIVEGNTISPVYQTSILQTTGSSVSLDAGIVDKINNLKSIIITALTEENTFSVPQANDGATVTIMVKTGTYSEILPIVVPANTALNGDELRGVVVKPKTIINTIATRSRSNTNSFTVATTEGMTNNMPVQFVSMNPVTGVNTVFGSPSIVAGQTYYVIGSSITPTTFSVSATSGIDVAIPLVNFVSVMRVYGGDALSDMFRVRNGSGIRNMTLTGLLGTLTPLNSYLTRRPTGGSFVSLDPGTNPDDTAAWITRKSPYIQNVTNFGIGCVGLKIDGTLHNGGNKSIVCNDFTQIISDGIGVWTTGPESLCEAVSVFSYYNYAGYMAEDGGRIRATNGNSSYGTYGCIAEGFDDAESPITATVNNRFNQALVSPISSLGSNASILAFQYEHAGEAYTAPTTNLLSYSNAFTNWASDGNVTLVQSIVSPGTQSDGWIATGNTSGSNSSYFYQDITIAPSGASYVALSGINDSGSGIGATFDVVVTSTTYIVTVNDGGSGYVATNQIRILGSQLGGINGTNDLIITVTGLTNGTTIQLISSTGIVQVGSTQPYTFSVYCKQGTATDFEVNAIFSGTSVTSSVISYNFASGIVTPSAGTGGFIPTSYGVIPVSSAAGWFRLYFTFYDSNALNDSLQIRFYPRSKFGNSGYTLLYGAQLEVGSSLGFYLKTTTNRFTSYANYEVVGAGSGVDVVGDEIRTGSIFQSRVTTSLGETGGTGYLLASNNAQTGTTSNITIAQTDNATEKTYLGMRIFINSGEGAGQYGVVSSYDPAFKIISVLKESFKQVSITSTSNSTGTFTLSSTADVNSLYVDQAIQFVPTNYNTIVTNISQRSLSVDETVGGIINTLKLPTTVRLVVNMEVTFSGVTFGGVTSGFTYYIVAIVNDREIQVSTTLGGPVTLLTAGTGSMFINYPANTNYLTAPTTNMDVNLPIFFTGRVIGDVSSGTTYYINDIIDGNTFTISATLVTTTATASTAVTNRISVDSSATMVPITPIIFTGTGFGGIIADEKYYINTIPTSTSITISNILINTSATQTSASGNLITVANADDFVIGNPIRFTGTTFGGLVNDRIYYVLYINNANTISVSTTSTLLQLTATETTTSTNLITVNTTLNLTPLNPITFSGTSAGGIVSGTTYYVSRIPDSSHFVISNSIVTTTATSTATISNLITVTSTAGFIANNPIIFGGPAIGGIVAGRVYFISAINDSTSFTVSLIPSGAAITLTTAIDGNMTVRTTALDTPLSTATVALTATTTFGGSVVQLTDAIGNVNVSTTGPVVALTDASSQSMTVTTTGAKETLTPETGTMTGTFIVPVLGGVSVGTTYYITSITPGVTNVFTVSDISPGGTNYTPVNSTGSMVMGEVGWDHVNPGTPSVSAFDSSTVYSIEPRIEYSSPEFSINSASAVLQAPSTTYIDIKFGNGRFVAIPSENQTIATSTSGLSWGAKTLPLTAAWKSTAYGNKYWIIISSAGTGSGSTVLYSNSDLETWKTSFLPSISNWSKVVYGNGKFVVITNDSGSAAVSNNFGATWTSMTGLSSTTWSSLTYGKGKFVAIETGGRTAAYSSDGVTWTTITTALPISSTWASVTYGNGRFVAVSTAGVPPAYSLDGITWSSALYPVTAQFISYGNGVFLALSTGSALGYTSEDGIRWTNRSVNPAIVGGLTFGFNPEFSLGRFVTAGGRSDVTITTAGATPKARVTITGSRISKIYEWETGSNYQVLPTLTITDTNATIPATVIPRIGNGTLSNPTFVNNGSGYNTSTTSILVTGYGYADDYQTGLSIVVNNLTLLPRAGDNLAIAGDTTIYKVTDAVALNGTTAPAILGRIQVSPEITVASSPDHGTQLTIRTKYSQVRLTNHDFLNIGYGNFEQSNYPRLPSETGLASNNEIIENNYGRAFFSSTDQDGNFKVGNLFAVEQATGIVTLSASQFGLTGLNELRLGGVSVGNASVIITQFSTDSTFVANSDAIIPTQKAIRAHLAARLSQGGSNTFTGQLTAGTVVVGGPDKIGSTVTAGQEGSVVKIPVVANIHRIGDGAGGGYGGWDGNGMAMAYFVKSGAHR